MIGLRQALAQGRTVNRTGPGIAPSRVLSTPDGVQARGMRSGGIGPSQGQNGIAQQIAQLDAARNRQLSGRGLQATSRTYTTQRQGLVDQLEEAGENVRDAAALGVAQDRNNVAREDTGLRRDIADNEMLSKLIGASAPARGVADGTDPVASIYENEDGTSFGDKKFVPAVARGGKINGPGTAKSDSIPAYLSDGEYVLPAETVEQIGTGRLNNLVRKTTGQEPGASEKKGLRGFNAGGTINSLSDVWRRPKWAGGNGWDEPMPNAAMEAAPERATINSVSDVWRRPEWAGGSGWGEPKPDAVTAAAPVQTRGSTITPGEVWQDMKNSPMARAVGGAVRATSDNLTSSGLGNPFRQAGADEGRFAGMTLGNPERIVDAAGALVAGGGALQAAKGGLRLASGSKNLWSNPAQFARHGQEQAASAARRAMLSGAAKVGVGAGAAQIPFGEEGEQAQAEADAIQARHNEIMSPDYDVNGTIPVGTTPGGLMTPEALEAASAEGRQAVAAQAAFDAAQPETAAQMQERVRSANEELMGLRGRLQEAGGGADPRDPGAAGLRALRENPELRQEMNDIYGRLGNGIQVSLTPGSGTPMFSGNGANAKANYTGMDGKPTKDWSRTADYRDAMIRNASSSDQGLRRQGMAGLAQIAAANQAEVRGRSTGNAAFDMRRAAGVSDELNATMMQNDPKPRSEEEQLDIDKKRMDLASASDAKHREMMTDLGLPPEMQNNFKQFIDLQMTDLVQEGDNLETLAGQRQFYSRALPMFLAATAANLGGQGGDLKMPEVTNVDSWRFKDARYGGTDTNPGWTRALWDFTDNDVLETADGKRLNRRLVEEGLRNHPLYATHGAAARELLKPR